MDIYKIGNRTELLIKMHTLQTLLICELHMQGQLHIYLPHYVVQEDEDTPTLLQQQTSQEACWLADVQYQDAGKK